MQTVTLSLFRFDSVAARLWAFGMMAAGRFALPRVPGLKFWKLCGTGTGEGFTPRPNTHVYAILCVWPDAETARNQLERARIFRRYRAHASEAWTVFLAPTSVRGQWAGVTPFQAQTPPETGLLAAMTRATVRPRRAFRFWSRVPDISSVIGADPNVIFKIGIGEVPLLHQVTFSIWPDADSMAAFARDRNGPHAKAIRAVRDENWFREELYARFRVTGERGTWGGVSPLAHNQGHA
ncbi:spheroidene monooxygenase [Lutimaribacter sp. EGI FJ00015]|uniref:Spheroidene monooxygenase n=1 Tax=Lutimaribacter degradans TaxID=2945989 RepID=A0ACC5ZUJ9_9RHOB|nr:spheroidene monooxygenase [Lutimaribacter sp. EGI FJ00013]MCM2562028.1 spheroidene monooxygenase [Lutimaribacter sp. EGI FJ00013]MCO0612940.1 spheroidene monooxygenase [Lutimaribacter sp. EGI FJ00015]MCO0635860.1 spheroidene monooxygenase [Lutimaribacter sp. EGI FJ00014]